MAREPKELPEIRRLRTEHAADKFVGTVKAVFTTKEGETRYAVDVEGHGTLRLCSDHTIVPHH
jgi:hypothetical protein